MERLIGNTPVPQTPNEVKNLRGRSPVILPRSSSTARFAESIGIKLVSIKAGEFVMGSPDSDKDASDDEKPQHSVRITKPFLMAAHEVTVRQFRKFVEDTEYKTEAEKDGKGSYGFNASDGKFEQKPEYIWRNPGFSQNDEHPVVNVSWNDAQEFCKWLTRKDGRTFRLPTEAEWEYCCRAGRTTRYHTGDDPETLARVGNVADGTAKKRFSGWTTISAEDGYVFTAPVGSFRANDFGLYDMDGNVWEWCQDWYASDYYKDPPHEDPQGPVTASDRVIRGGCWGLVPGFCRAGLRGRNGPSNRSIGAGFRLAAVQ